MTSPAVTCSEMDSLRTVAGLMWQRDIGALPVVGDNNMIIGMVTGRDISIAAYRQGQALSEITIAQVTNGEVFAVSPHDTLLQASQTMMKHSLRRLPVVADGDQVIGMITLNDIRLAVQGQ